MGIPSRARVFAETEHPQLLILRHTCRSGKDVVCGGALWARALASIVLPSPLRPRSAAVVATTSRTASRLCRLLRRVRRSGQSLVGDRTEGEAFLQKAPTKSRGSICRGQYAVCVHNGQVRFYRQPHGASVN